MATRKVDVDLDFGAVSKIVRALLNPLASDPGSPVVGEVWYNTTDSRLKVQTGGGTVSLATTADTGSGVPASTWDAQSYVKAIADDTPIVQVVAASEVVGRRASGDLGVISYANLITDLEALGIDADTLGGQNSSYHLNRTNHTGTQTASTISDFDTQVRTSRLDQMAAPTASVDFNSQKITGLLAGTATTDAVNKQQLDDAVAGLAWKDSVRAATTTNITLSGTQTIDTVGVIADDRVLVKDQSTPAQNGIYVVAAGSWVRASDANTSDELVGMAVYVTEGGQAGTAWTLTTPAPIVVDTTSLTYSQFGGGQVYTAGDGLTLTGNDFDVVGGTGISVTADQVAIDTSVVVRKYATDIGNGSLQTFTVNHALGTTDVTVSVYDNSTKDEVECEISHTDANNVTIDTNSVPTSNQYRVVVHG